MTMCPCTSPAPYRRHVTPRCAQRRRGARRTSIPTHGYDGTVARELRSGEEEYNEPGARVRRLLLVGTWGGIWSLALYVACDYADTEPYSVFMAKDAWIQIGGATAVATLATSWTAWVLEATLTRQITPVWLFGVIGLLPPMVTTFKCADY